MGTLFPSQKGHISPPTLQPMFILDKWSPISATAEHLPSQYFLDVTKIHP